MSGGEQQMCAIGRALMARPKLLLLDEPSMGLAPIFVERIFEIIKEINEQGTSILLVEQNALMALDAANRGYVLETGRIVLADTAAALKVNEQVRKTYLGERPLAQRTARLGLEAVRTTRFRALCNPPRNRGSPGRLARDRSASGGSSTMATRAQPSRTSSAASCDPAAVGSPVLGAATIDELAHTPRLICSRMCETIAFQAISTPTTTRELAKDARPIAMIDVDHGDREGVLDVFRDDRAAGVRRLPAKRERARRSRGRGRARASAGIPPVRPGTRTLNSVDALAAGDDQVTEHAVATSWVPAVAPIRIAAMFPSPREEDVVLEVRRAAGGAVVVRVHGVQDDEHDLRDQHGADRQEERPRHEAAAPDELQHLLR